LDFINRGLALFPGNLLLKEELCLLMEEQGMIEEALQICGELIEAQPLSTDYRFLQGRLYAVMKAYDKAIESFENISIFDDDDLEINLMKTYCHFMNEQYFNVVEIYLELFPDDLLHVGKNFDPFNETPGNVEIAYLLLRKMLEEFEIDFGFSQIGIKIFPSCTIENEEDTNGFLLVADSFPGSIGFFFFKELLLLAEGEQTAIMNIEQILEILYQKGLDNENIRIDTVNTSCIPQLRQKAEKILDTKKPGIDCDKNDLNTVRQIINYISEPNISKFCRLYEDHSTEMISKCLEKIFLPVEKRRKRKAKRLSKDFQQNTFDAIPSNELAARYLTDKNHNN
jgi:tetratricopeptide (TPR) repeat protein